jgi:hypothetical protein
VFEFGLVAGCLGRPLRSLLVREQAEEQPRIPRRCAPRDDSVRRGRRLVGELTRAFVGARGLVPQRGRVLERLRGWDRGGRGVG